MANPTGFDLNETFDDTPVLPDPLQADPFPMFVEWYEEARVAGAQPNPNAMSLATVDASGMPSVRVVLCKSIDPASGHIVFYTNYTSRKGQELDATGLASVVFHWDHAERQVRIEGRVVKSPPEESDAYFQSRSWERRLGAWSSDQSRPLASREALLEQVAERAMELDLDLSLIVDGKGEELKIPRPPHWGGYRLYAERVELWCAGVGRVHDRARWSRELAPVEGRFAGGAWSVTRLQP